MARAKKKMTKAMQEEEIKALRARKERDAKLNYKYIPCKFCGCSVAWRLPVGMEDILENRAKFEPKNCGKEECCKAFLDEQLRLKGGKQ